MYRQTQKNSRNNIFRIQNSKHDEKQHHISRGLFSTIVAGRFVFFIQFALVAHHVLCTWKCECAWRYGVIKSVSIKKNSCISIFSAACQKKTPEYTDKNRFIFFIVIYPWWFFIQFRLLKLFRVCFSIALFMVYIYTEMCCYLSCICWKILYKYQACGTFKANRQARPLFRHPSPHCTVF